MIIASMSTFPHRKATFKQSVSSILVEQSHPIDRLHVYLYRYAQIDPDLPHDSRLEYHLECPDAGPWVRYLIADKLDDQDILVTLDDDTLYPRDYIETGLRELTHFGPGNMICFSGICWDPFVDRFIYTEDRWQCVSEAGMERHRIVSQHMGQTSFFWAGSAKNIVNFAIPGFHTNDDMMTCYMLQKRKIRAWCCPKPAQWIRDLETAFDDTALTKRDAPVRRKAFYEMVTKLGFDPTAGRLAEFRAYRKRVLVLADNCPPLAGAKPLDEALRGLCDSHATIHVLAPVAASQVGIVQHYVNTPYEIHTVGVPEPGGRFDSAAPVRAWRNWRVQRSQRILWNARAAQARAKLQPTAEYRFIDGKLLPA
jgi:hypothetical protein